ncbi:uncharacterized protein UV8b_02640 [Ustilaginoidea virens]|uniref:Serine-threonine protein kinase 19 n=1 Tax=Ustilaginoidea virens TaxID=1159556 RepID=A0A063C850_USTVR|nr:uncharacterized protein UV8b_02640 [Ustilaginoidea virens]QUC18399.1 hypothetical protein UV8b_02640 [Ustilaginoidea virens]GAO14432.1 hypothetical protein UVI_02031740 [Ustilaginoidea virens]
MPQSIRSILGKTRVAKAKPAAQRTASSAHRGTKPQSRRSARHDALFPDKLEDLGGAPVLTEREELTLRDVVQAMRYIRSRMFSAVPETGLTSTRRAEMLRRRASMPPVVAASHVQAVLGGTAPARVEREIAELVGRGVLRRVRVARRGGAGEALVETRDLEGMLGRARDGGGLSAGARDAFLDHLRRNPTAQTVGWADGLTRDQVDELVRAGFLTSAGSTTPAPGPSALSALSARPEDRTTLTSIQHVSRFASGTASAVGGRNAVHLAGGGGGSAVFSAAHGRPESSSSCRVAVPGHGRHLKLADGAADWIRDVLGKTAWGEGPESWLKERFEGNGLRGTRWRDFCGLEWEWLLGQAVGLGVVEVFDTGSVGRGVRALGG